MPRGVNGHLAAKHVAMETEQGFDLAFHIVTTLNQVIYRALDLVMLEIVSPFLLFFHSRQ